MDDGKLTYYMRWIAGITAILVAYGSAKLSVAGIGLEGDLWWLNWVIAVSLFVTEFMVNGKHTELNWLMLVMGIGAYAYSIATNIIGIGDYMSVNNAGDGTLDTITKYAGGFFMDIYPELVLRWALGESKVGDILGNLVKTANNPEILTKSFVTEGGYKVNHRRVQSNSGKSRREELENSRRVQPSPRPIVKPERRDMDDEEPDDIQQFIKKSVARA